MNFLKFLVKFFSYSLLVLVPIVYSPYTFEYFEFNKQILIIFFSLAAFISYLAYIALSQKQLVYRKNPLIIPLGGLVVVWIVSLSLSVDKISSLFGFYGRFVQGFIGSVSLVIFALLLFNELSLRGERILNFKGVWKSFVWSGLIFYSLFFYSIFNIGKLFGSAGRIIDKIFNFGFSPLAGSLEPIAILSAGWFVLMVLALIWQKKEDKQILGGVLSGKIIPYVLGVFSLLSLLIIDFWVAWLALAVVFLVFLAYAFSVRVFKEKPNVLLIPIFIFIVSAALIFIKTPIISSYMGQVPKEINLDYGTAAKITLQSIKNYPAFGVGQANFFYSFTFFRPQSFYQSDIWNLRFDRAGSHILESFNTTGVIGGLAYFGLLLFFIYITWSFVKKIKSEWLPLPLVFFFAWLIFVIAQFFYNTTSVLNFYFWVLMFLSLGAWVYFESDIFKERVLDLKNFPEIELVSSTIVIILGLGFLGMVYYGGNIYRADMNFKRALNSQNIEKRISFLETAASLNPLAEIYSRSLARAYTDSALNMALNKESSVDDIGFRAKLAIDRVQSITAKNSDNVVNWQIFGNIYSDLRSIISGVDSWAVQGYEKAMAIENNNPILDNELGRILRQSGDNEKAVESLRKALDVKPQMASATVQWALIEESNNNLDKSIELLENHINSFGFNVDAAFHLGRYYFNNNETDKAITMFQGVLQVNPLNSNVRYALATALRKKGELGQALEQYKIVLQLNPDQEEIRGVVEEIQRKL